MFKALPVFLVPDVEIVQATVKLFEWIDLESLLLAVAHGIANYVPARSCQPIELVDQGFLRPLKQIVIIATAQQ